MDRVFNHPLQAISFNQANTAYVVEASAGTGKTWTIERLFIKALLEAVQPDNPELPLAIENILVVTFTNDATDELKQRISEQIQSTINLQIYLNKHTNNNLVPELANDIFVEYLLKRQSLYDYKKDITVLTRALQNFDASSIYTIHGFCNKILHEYQFECQVNTEFDLVANKANILEQIVLDFMRSQIFTNPAFSDKLDNVLANLDGLFTSNNYSLSLIERITGKIPKDLFKISSNNYQLKYALDGVEPSLVKLTLSEMDIETQRIAKAEFLAYLFAYIAQHYPIFIAKTNSISYDELIQKVADSLMHSKTLADKLFTHYPIAFIDEFQDTDALQWQMFSTIYQLEGNKRGNVVVVGDPKQAIYRFRGADVDTYIEARNQIGNQLVLDTNFRSNAHIMNFVNQLFSLTNQGCNSEQSFLGNGIDYAPIKAHGVKKISLPSAKQLEGLARDVGVDQHFYDDEVQIVTINGVTKPERNNKLLQSMTLEILALLKANPDLKGKIAILVTKNQEGSDIVRYLRKYGVKAAELKLGNIFATATAHSLFLFLTAVNDLTNRRNFIRAITTKLFNLPLTSLSIDANDKNEILQRLQQDFFGYQQIWSSKGLISLVYALLTNLFKTTDGGAVLNNRELANLWQLAELLNASAITNQIELLFWFKQKISNAENNQAVEIDGNNEELVRLDNDDEQIIITTQHKAKGLEYEILFCPYFKNNATLDGTYDFNYRRPFFSNYRAKNQHYSAMVMDKHLGEQIVENDNKEGNRLNYVALTRARSRLYIYLKQHTYTRDGRYNSVERPDKLVELFGYVKSNPKDNQHKLFDYSAFFSNNPGLAIKDSALLPGVAVYNRDDVIEADLDSLRYINTIQLQTRTKINFIVPNWVNIPSYSRQSYTGLTRHNTQVEGSTALLDGVKDNNSEANIVFAPVNYRYSILNDKSLKGASFGVLFHSLCELYPFNQATLLTTLNQYNINTIDNDYPQQLSQMLDEAFAYPVIDNIPISAFASSQHELEFNLHIRDSILISTQGSQLLSDYFGSQHPFSQASRTLGQIDSGFLVGFIDLIFLHEGKYWVLDYKTNTLDSYISTKQSQNSGSLIDSMAEHHYYLQYLLYLVALKRHLEKRLKLDDATDLIGGAIYYYIRGVFIENNNGEQSIYTDKECKSLIRDLDNLFKGDLE